ncbi:E22 family MetX-like putative esterase [Alteromonas sp. ASW11-130]|uniref:E22 family MetX-like putative esterase n=1 Tax=Alteromonas sp. ASW11-130 TaxID=3015775 RepID=UPI0022420FBF|nr:homoserine O-acetyltransferase [Alteromonas sp. ASW11-130]MCW8091427.1 homoserine O-acetyltransferase [Alteromonas sp. ASW11-130]
MYKFALIWLVLCLSTVTEGKPASENLLVEKQIFTTHQFELFNGKVLPEVKVGWESYGKLNADKSNAILVTHYFTGTSHAAGKYHSDDETAGYWDAIIGPGKAIDTNRYFVVSVDSLANINAYDENVVTTGPASINPQTNQPWGLDFPVVTIRDFVNIQKAVLQSLGIETLHAVIGPSMGSMQALDWAAAYPEQVKRVISVIGSGESDAWTTAMLEQWTLPIKLDPKWNNGNYAKDHPPVEGLVASLMLITQQALTPAFFNNQGNMLSYAPLERGPLNDINMSHTIVNWLKQRAASRTEKMDANSLLYLARACQLYVAGHQHSLKKGLKRVTAPSLFLPSESDLLLMPYLAEGPHQLLNQSSKLLTLEGQFGHLEGVVNVQQHAEAITTFLNNPVR